MLDAGCWEQRPLPSLPAGTALPQPGRILQMRWRGAAPPVPPVAPALPRPSSDSHWGLEQHFGCCAQPASTPKSLPRAGLIPEPSVPPAVPAHCPSASTPLLSPRQSCPRPTVPGWRSPMTCRSSSPATSSAHAFTRYLSYRSWQISVKSCRGVGQRIAGGRQRQEKHGEGLGPLVGDAGVTCRVPSS